MSFYNQITQSQRPKKFDLRRHTLGVVEEDITQDNEWIMLIIDPGTTRFGIRVEKRSRNSGIKTLYMDNAKIDTRDSDDITVYWNLSQLLLRVINQIKNITIFVIEWQMPINYRTVRVSQHCVTFFQMYLFKRTVSERAKCRIAEIDPRTKTQVLHGPSGEGKSIVKQWSRYVASQLLERRGDLKGLSIINNKYSDRTDMADTIVLAECYATLTGLYSDFDCLKNDKFVRLLTVRPEMLDKNAERMGVNRKDLDTFLEVAEKFGLVNESSAT